MPVTLPSSLITVVAVVPAPAPPKNLTFGGDSYPDPPDVKFN